MSYDSNVRSAKDAFTNLICDMTYQDIERFRTAVARNIDNLNKAWDELTDALVRQRTERDRIISDLMNQLAEAKK